MVPTMGFVFQGHTKMSRIMYLIEINKIIFIPIVQYIEDLW